LKDVPDSPRRSIHEAIDDLFDDVLDDEQARRVVREADARACEEIVKTQRMLSLLKRPVEAPDLARRILAQVEGEREFIGGGWRRFVRMGRLAVAACLLLTLLGVAAAQRYWPEATTLRTEPRPVSVLLTTTERKAADSVRAIDTTLEVVGQVACDVSDVAQQSRRNPDKITSPERLVVLATAHPAGPEVHLTATVRGVATPGGGAPSFRVYDYSPAPRADASAGLLGYRSDATVQAGFSAVWNVDVAKLNRLRSHAVKAEIRDVGVRSAIFRELP
jgi:hypothetical protein